MSIIATQPVVRTAYDVVDLMTNWDALQPMWDEYVDTHPKGSIFHTADMLRVFAAAKGHRPIALAAVDKDGAILSLLAAVRVQTLPSPFGKVSSRSVLYAEPLCENDERSISSLVRLITEHDARIGRNTLFTEVRPLFAPGPERVALERCGYEFMDYLNYIVDISGSPEAIWQRMNRNARRAIKKAESAGYEVAEMEAAADVDQLYEFVKMSYGHSGVPMADKSLFKAAFKFLHGKNQMKVLAVKRGNEVATMYAVLQYKRLAYAWYVGTKRNPGFSPMDLLNWSDFVRCHERGYTQYDMGGAGWPNEEYGVRDYKSKFGGELVRYGRYRKINSPFKLALAEQAYNLRRRLSRRLRPAVSES